MKNFTYLLIILLFIVIPASCIGADNSCNELCLRDSALSALLDLRDYQSLFEEYNKEYVTLTSIILILDGKKNISKIEKVTLGQIYGYRWLLNEELGNRVEAKSDCKKSVDILGSTIFPGVKADALRKHLNKVNERFLNILKDKYKDKLK